MPKRKFIDKKSATTFALVHRAQNDPLLHDEDAPSMVLAEKGPQQRSRRPTEDDYAYSSAASAVSGESSFRSSKTKQRGDLEEEFGLAVRANEGEAAQHGVFFDDSEYDYMQHMRDLGAAEGPVAWVEASAPSQQKGKGKQKLEDALRGLDIAGEQGRFDDAVSTGTQETTSSAARSLLPEEMFGSDFARRRTYQDQQDVPDEIAGFQPDMDPRLCEMLEALEDEAYVEDEDEDFFKELLDDGAEYEKDTWEEMGVNHWEEDENDDAWEDEAEGSDADTIRASSPPPSLVLDLPESETAKPPEDAQAVPPADPTDGAWIDEFKKFKSANREVNKLTPLAVPPSGLESSALSSLATGPKKKRKGAKTSTTNYSMTSSALARTDQQTLLDDRFDKIEATYTAAEYDDDVEDGRFDDALSSASGISRVSQASKASKYSAVSGMSKASRMSTYSRASDADAPQLQRSDFDSIMDDFLSASGKSRGRGKIKRGGAGLAGQTGMQQLDEIRQGLGKARTKPKTTAAGGG